MHVLVTDKNSSIRGFILSEITQMLSFNDTSIQDHESRIHEYRKALKRCRSLLRLIRYCMSAFSYERINGLLSNASKEIEEQRDSTVLLQTYLNLMKVHEDRLSPWVKDTVKDYLEMRLSNAYVNIETKILNNYESLFSRYLKTAYCELYTLKSDPCDASDVQTVIEKSYYTAANLYLNSKKTLDTQVIHKWRKSCKHLLLQLKFAPDNDAGSYHQLINTLDHIIYMLGIDHDLAMLGYVIQNLIPILKDDIQRMLLIIFKERAKLQKLIFRTGEDLFSEDQVRNFRFVSCY